jgi:hypothetical protein
MSGLSAKRCARRKGSFIQQPPPDIEGHMKKIDLVPNKKRSLALMRGNEPHPLFRITENYPFLQKLLDTIVTISYSRSIEPV